MCPDLFLGIPEATLVAERVTVPAAHSNLVTYNYLFTYNFVNHFYNFLNKSCRACIAP